MRAMLIAVFALLSISAFAERDGNLMLPYCTAAVSRGDGAKLDEAQLSHATTCIAYVGGFLDALDAMTVISPKATGVFCSPVPPSNLPAEQVARIFVKYLRAHPERLHDRAGDLLIFSLVDAFPCTK